MPKKKNQWDTLNSRQITIFAQLLAVFLLNVQRVLNIWLLAAHRQGKHHVYLGLLFTVHADGPSQYLFIFFSVHIVLKRK